jgi:TPR repeat protein
MKFALSSAALLMSCALCCAASAATPAADLADADAAFARKAYPEALQKYTRLAGAGNTSAQQHLGEMYFYGEAGAVDIDKATQWFTKAAAKGNAVATASLEMIRQRTARRKELDWWITGYDGSDVRTDEFRCTPPRFPAVSKVNEEIDTIAAKMKSWQECHNRYADHLAKSTPLVNRIPDDINKLLTKPEIEKAAAHMAQVQEGLAEDSKVGARLVMADYNVWRNATEAYIAEHNDILKNSPPSEEDLDALRSKRAK